MPTRRQFLLASVTSSVGALATRRTLFAAAMTGTVAPPKITVYKDPGCECCSRWCKYLASNGFVVDPRDVADVDQIKRTMNVPKDLQSCHTAVVGRYVVEGHAPADVIKKLLAERPAVMGIAVPGMPMGSPGMESDRKDRFTVVAFDRTGKTRVFATRGG